MSWVGGLGGKIKTGSNVLKDACVCFPASTPNALV